jgi:protein phosphatase
MSTIRAAALSDTGRRRRRNEDAFVCEPPLFAIADGMGGAQAGELASQLAAGAVREGQEPTGDEAEQRVVALIREANRRVWERQRDDASTRGMGTTMTVALVAGGEVVIGHVGDSRAYLLRRGSLEQLTADHSLVAELVRSGRLSPEEADSHPHRSVITRALGTEPDVEVDTLTVPAEDGDLFLLCSDGLTAMVSDAAILAVLERSRESLEQSARSLVDAANDAGGEDNVTVVLFAPGTTAAAEAQPDTVDEEATLSGLEGIPVIAPAELEPPPPQTANGAPPREPPVATPRPRRRGRIAAYLVLVAGLLVVLTALTLLGLSRAHFVGAQRDGHVVVYQGFPFDVAGHVRLYRPVYVSPLLAAQLTRSERRHLFGHNLESYGSALRQVQRLEQEIEP